MVVDKGSDFHERRGREQDMREHVLKGYCIRPVFTTSPKNYETDRAQVHTHPLLRQFAGIPIHSRMRFTRGLGASTSG